MLKEGTPCHTGTPRKVDGSCDTKVFQSSISPSLFPKSLFINSVLLRPRQKPLGQGAVLKIQAKSQWPLILTDTPVNGAQAEAASSNFCLGPHKLSERGERGSLPISQLLKTVPSLFSGFQQRP